MSRKQLVERFQQLEVEFFHKQASNLVRLGTVAEDSYLYGEFAFLLLGLKPSLLVHFPPAINDLYLQQVIDPVLKELPNICIRILGRVESEEMDLTNCLLLYHCDNIDSISAVFDRGSRIEDSQLAEILDYPGSLPRSLPELDGMSEVAYIDANSQALLTTYAALKGQQQKVRNHFERYQQACQQQLGMNLQLIIRRPQ